MSGPLVKPAPPSHRSFWHSVKTIGWAFLGIRKKSDFQADLGKVSPIHVISVAIAAVLVFVFVLIGVIKWVVLR